jgi:hypothetical protein
LTLDTYSHVLPTMQERATEKLERMLYGQGWESAEEDANIDLKAG